MYFCARSRLRYIHFDQDLIAREMLFCRSEVRESLWPEPVVVRDYSKLKRRIRDLNREDTFTQDKELDRKIRSRDYTGARSLLSTLVPRRPDIGKAKELLGWEPKVSLDEGLLTTLEYFKKRNESADR